MEYIKVSFNIEPNSEVAREILIAELAEFAFDSFEETETGVNAYVQSSEYNEDDIKTINIIQNEEYKINYETEIIPDQNWNKTWEQYYFKPIVVGKECVIKSRIHTDAPQGKYEIFIEPQMSFGTGHHETTRLVIKHILETDFDGKSVLDMGCGTGILGILASMRGASKVLGIDIEDWAYANANENIALNNLSNMKVACGDASLLGNEKFDVVIANINRNILLQDIKKYIDVLNDDGTLILSGFYQWDVAAIDKECLSNNLFKFSGKEDNNWASLAYTLGY